jgi:hypothetical protein
MIEGVAIIVRKKTIPPKRKKATLSVLESRSFILYPPAVAQFQRDKAL